MADLVLLQQRRAQAEDALHRLLTGALVVEVMRDGRRVTYAAARDGVARLREYIAELDAQIAEITGEIPASPMLRRRALRVSFG